MSFNLELKDKNPFSARLDPFSLDEWFSNRPFYQLVDSGAVYRNVITGVYFVFRWSMTNGFVVIFDINYFRPTPFIYEAMEELEEFVKSFDLIIEDQQKHVTGEFDREALVESWKEGNEKVLKDLLPKMNNPPPSLPITQLEFCWKWNRNPPKSDLQITFFQFYIVNEHTVISVQWEGKPAIIPPSEYITFNQKLISRAKVPIPIQYPYVEVMTDLQKALEQLPSLEAPRIPFESIIEKEHVKQFFVPGTLHKKEISMNQNVDVVAFISIGAGILAYVMSCCVGFLAMGISAIAIGAGIFSLMRIRKDPSLGGGILPGLELVLEVYIFSLLVLLFYCIF